MITFVYFDVGGVALSDFSGTDRWVELKQELGVTPDVDEAFMRLWEPFEQEAVVGRDIEDLLPTLRTKLGLAIPDNYSLLNGFVSRFSVNQPIWPIIERVKQHVNVGLLTNMYPGMLEAIFDAKLLPPIAWDAIAESSVEKLKKPDAAFFKLAEEKAQASGKQILFIDNTKGHVDAAAAFGWQVYHYDASNHSDSCAKLERYLAEQRII